MTYSATPDLGQTKIQRLLANVGSAPVEAENVPEAVVYDWRDPHYYNEDQRNRLAAIMSQVSALLSEQFAHFYNGDFDVTPSSIVQFFASALSNHIDPNAVFTLPFDQDDGQSCGYLAIENKTAIDWGARLLGDAESDGEQERTLSSLEESLLTDLTRAIGQTFLNPLRPHVNLTVSNGIIKHCPDLGLEAMAEICMIVFQIKRTDSDDTSEVSFVFPCQILASLVGKQAEAAPDQPQDVLARALMGHVQQMPVTLGARLATTRLSFKDVLDLGPDDILLMDKPIDEPIDVIADGQTIFRGRPAQSNGQYAVFVTERMTKALQETGKAPGTN